MKILCFVDLHENFKALEKLREKAEKADFLICAGDFTLFERSIGKVARKLESFRKKIYIIPGNHEVAGSVRKISALSDFLVNIHKKTLLIPPLLLVGHGGGGFAEVDEEFEQFSSMIEGTIKQLKKQFKELKIILVTHAPPFKTLLDTVQGNSVGCKSYRRFIDKIKPDFAIAGHIHENSGKEGMLGKTRLINPGPFGKIIQI